jgi:hypothetical protein
MAMTDVCMAEEEAGKRAYERYAYFTGGKTFDGRDMPTWTGLTQKIRDAWCGAAWAVVQFERGLIENGAEGVGVR